MITERGRIVGYTIGNDMSSRDIEGENPLYLPQAKVYDGELRGSVRASSSRSDPLPPATEVQLAIDREREAGVRGDDHARVT